MVAGSAEERITELESRIAFQDATINTLNECVVEQQKRIDQLQRQVQVLSDQIKNALPDLIADPSQETPPPHY